MAEPLPDLIEEIVTESMGDDPATLLAALAGQDEVYIASLLESLPVEKRLAVWEGIPRDRKLDVLVEMRSDPREILIDNTPHDEWASIFADIDVYWNYSIHCQNGLSIWPMNHLILKSVSISEKRHNSPITK